MKKASLLCIGILSAMLHTLTAQTVDGEKLDWWGDIDGFINQQDKVALGLVNKALEKYPPTLEEPLERKMAMLMLDGVLHEENAPQKPAVQEFLEERITKSLGEMQRTKVKQGARIWKLYNHGFVIRTASVTIGFDIVQASYFSDSDRFSNAEGFSLSGPLMEQIVEQCDVLFISHRHGDHADIGVAQTFLDHKKPVVAPPEVWSDLPIHKTITHLKREAHTKQKLKVQQGAQELTVINYPGHQGKDIENNVPLVFTPEGMSFVQTGDQSGPVEDWDWIDTAGTQNRVDVLFPNCWTPDIQRMVKGFKPAMVITGHENEMAHTIDHRESNWLTYTRLKGSPAPYLLLAWGESFHYVP